MQLNEVIEENSLSTISKRTRISVENIERLVNRDFSTLKRVKAIGFISILEREFSTDLTALKRDCAEYFSSSGEEDFDAKLVLTIPESDDRGGSSVMSKLFMLILLCAIGYGAWYFLANKEESMEHNTTIVSNTTLFGSIVNQAQEWIGSIQGTFEGSTPDGTDGAWAETDTESNGSSSQQSDDVNTEPDSSDTDKNNSTSEEQIIRNVKEEQKDIVAKELEQNNSGDTNIGNVLQRDSAVEKNTDDTPAVSPDDQLAIEVPSMSEEVNADEVTAVPQEPKPDKTQEKKEPAPVILQPTEKVWVGYTDLSTMKRSAKLISNEIKFEPNKDGWIIVTGHKSIKFISKNKKAVPKAKGKNYFLIKNGIVSSISKEKFQKLNKSTVW